VVHQVLIGRAEAVLISATGNGDGMRCSSPRLRKLALEALCSPRPTSWVFSPVSVFWLITYGPSSLRN
jgi:hypothetical protein